MAHVDLSDRLRETRARLDRQRADAGQSRAKFARLERKETRVREDQYAELTSLARALMRDRVSRRERITENTLIRVAIDLLLAHRGQLRGSDEEQLRRSVMPGVSDFRNAQHPGTETSTHPKPRTSKVPESQTPRVPDNRTRARRGHDEAGAS